MTRAEALEVGSTPSSVEYLGVVLDQEGVGECEHGRRSVFVRRDELIYLLHEVGWRAERPIVQAIFGGALLAAGLHMFVAFVSVYIRDGAIFLPKTFTALGITLPIMGAWALFGALRRGHFLRAVLADGDSRKLLFQGRFDAAEFEAFVSRAREIGYAIRRS